MAFSKAKLFRFNDIKSCAPPPGAYNPKYEQHATKAAIFSKDTKEKTLDPPPSPASSCADAKSVNSCVSVPTFRTPTVPKKKKIALFNSVGKSLGKSVSTKLFSPNRSPKSEKKITKTDESEALREKTVECQNKDETITDLESQIEELEQMIRNVNNEKEQLTQEKKETLEKLNTFQTELADANLKLSENKDQNKELLSQFIIIRDELLKLQQLEESFSNLQKELVTELEEKESNLEQTQQKLTEKENTCQTLEQQLIKIKEENLKLMFQYEESLHVQSDIQKRHASEIETIQKVNNNEIQDLEFELLKEMTESHKLLKQHTTLQSNYDDEIKSIRACYEFQVKTLKEETNSIIGQKEETCIEKIKLEEIRYEIEKRELIDNYELEIKSITYEAQAQIRQSEENCTEKIKLTEIQMEEKTKEFERNWQLHLEEQEHESTEILKECQSIAEFNIIQCEVEKNQIKLELKKTEESINKLKEDNETLLLKNKELENALSDLKTDFSNIIIELNETREKLGREADLRQKNLDTALKEKHLYEIILNKIYDTVNALKTRLLDSDRDVEQLKDELENLEIEKLEIESNYIQVSKEIPYILEINETLKSENLLLNDVQDKVSFLEVELHTKVDDLKLKYDQEIVKLNKVISEKQTAVDDLNSYIQLQQKMHNDLQFLVTDAKNEIERQETEFVDHIFQISRLEASLNSSNKELLNHGAILEKKNEYIMDLEEKLKEKDSEVHEMTNTYKNYIETNKNMEKNYDDLVFKCQKLEKIVSEQNALIGPFRKQLSNLKKNNSIENKIEYEAKISQQNKTIEKLKQEIANLIKNKRSSKSVVPSDKENICSPVRPAFNSSLLDSPGKSPLKERN